MWSFLQWMSSLSWGFLKNGKALVAWIKSLLKWSFPYQRLILPPPPGLLHFMRQKCTSGHFFRFTVLLKACSHHNSLTLRIVIIRKQPCIFHSVSFHALFYLINSIIYKIVILLVVTSGIKPFLLIVHKLNFSFPISVFTPSLTLFLAVLFIE